MDRYLRGFGLPREKKQEVPLVKHASLVAIVSFHMSALVPLSAVILLVYLLSFTTIFISGGISLKCLITFPVALFTFIFLLVRRRRNRWRWLKAHLSCSYYQNILYVIESFFL